VQWYGFTSSSGGTVWVLLVNYLILRSLEPFPKTHYPCLLSGFLLIALPVLLSPIVQAPTNDGHKVTLAIVQPNIHPQKEKFGGMDADAQFSKAIRLLDAADTKSLEIVVFPETMIVDPIDEALIDESVYVRTLREIMKDLGLTSVFIGAFTKRHTGWHPSDDASVIASSPPFVLYNSLLLVRRDSIDVYHKEKLVPLVEKQPFQWLMKPLRSFIERSGAFFGSYGTYNRRHQLTIDEQHAAVPLICFESAFSCFPQPSPMASFVVLVTNDGWWSSSGGYIQHLNLARLRAIERGQWIARAANTGISGVINPRGEIVGSIDYNSEGILIAEVPYSFNNDRISFSVQKWMRWTALGFLVAVLFFNAVKRLRF
jgi:apolipoprotein N-acyltransferase